METGTVAVRDGRGHVGLETGNIVSTALEILNNEGLAGLTTRRIAQAEGVKHPALYHHFKNKQELLGHVSAALLSRSLQETPPCGTWPQWLKAFSSSVRRVLLDHRDGAAVVAGSDPTAYTKDYVIPAICQPMISQGVSSKIAYEIYSCTASFTLGWVINEQNEAKKHLMADAADLDRVFAEGIAMLVDGYARKANRLAAQVTG